MHGAQVDDKQNLQELIAFQQLSEQIRVNLDPDEVANSLFDLMRRLIDIEGVGLYIFQERPSAFVPVGTESLNLLDLAVSLNEDGVVDWVFQQERPVFSDTTSSFSIAQPLKTDTLLLVPLMVGDKRVGMLFAEVQPAGDEVSPFRQTLIFMAASQAAVAIKHAQDYQETEKNKTYLDRILQTVDDIIFSTDTAGMITFINDEVERFGYHPKQLTGKAIYAIIPVDLDEGRTVDVLQKGQSFEYESEFELPDGVTAWFSVHQVPLRGSDREITGCLGIMRDITARRLLEQELARGKRLEALTEAAISIRHEFNNPLTVIKGNLYLLANLLPLDENPDMKTVINTLTKHTERLAEVVKRFDNIEAIETTDYHGEIRMLNLNNYLSGEEDEDSGQKSTGSDEDGRDG